MTVLVICGNIGLDWSVRVIISSGRLVKQKNYDNAIAMERGVIMAKKNYNVVGIDVGYGFVKAVTGLDDKPVIFPSLISPASDGDVGIGKARTIFTVDSTDYFVGADAGVSKLARHTVSRDRLKSSEFKVLFLYALCKLFPKGIGDIFVATGLPGSWLKDAEELSRSLTGPFNVKVDGKAVGHFVDKVEPYPQAFGSWVREAFTVNGNGKPTVADKNLATQPTLVVDFGTATTGFAMLSGNYISERSGSIEVGMNDVLVGLRRACSAEFRYEPSYTELVKATMTGKLTVFGKAQDITSLLASHKDNLVDAAVSQANTLWQGGQQASTLLLTGGGASVVGDDFKRKFGHPNTILLPESQTANVKGLWLYGKYRSA